MEERFHKLEERFQGLEDEFHKLSARVEVTIGSMGRLWGSDLERMVLEIFKKVLEERGIEPGNVRKFRFKDKDRSITGIKGKIVNVDILVRDSKLYVMEVKSRAELDHVEYLVEKAKFVEIAMGGKLMRSW